MKWKFAVCGKRATGAAAAVAVAVAVLVLPAAATASVPVAAMLARLVAQSLRCLSMPALLAKPVPTMRFGLLNYLEANELE